MIHTRDKQLLYGVDHYINGKFVTSNGKQLDIYNPATGEAIGKVAVADQAVVDKAVEAAKAAFLTWSKTTPLARAKIMFRFKALIEENIQQLAHIVTREHGKTLAESIGSIARGLDVVDYACNIPVHLTGVFADKVGSDVDCYSLKQPLGVCAGITPFNFPAMIPLWMFPMAVACGNTFILKPSEKDPSCSNRLAELAREAGLPEGVLNIVHGNKETVDAILTHPDIQAISFVGSSSVASYIQKTAVSQHKRVQAFGGAKNHCVILPDANIEEVAKAIVSSAFGCAGERCMAISVAVVVGDQLGDQLCEAMRPLIEGLRIGPGDNDQVEMGPLITQEQVSKVESYIQRGIAEGAKLVVDGSQRKLPQRGFFMGGYLFDHVQPTMQIYQEEIFGPVLCVVRVNSLESALQLINNHAYGNGTAIFTRDGAIARKFAETVQAGMVGINVPIPVPVAYQSFGGWKQSIFADIGMYGNESVRFYTKLKTVTQRWSVKE